MFDIESGPPGVEVPHSWDGNSFVLNDLDAYPLIKIDGITGFLSLPEADDNRLPNTGRRGERELPSQERGKTIVYEGSVQARTQDDLKKAVTRMHRAFRDRSYSKLMRLVGQQQWIFRARVMQLDADSRHAMYVMGAPRPWQVPFTLGLRMPDGRFYAWPTPGGGGPYADGATVDCTNLGSSDTEPVFTVNVANPDTNVVLISGTTGRQLIFLKLPAGTLTVDFGQRQNSSINGGPATAYLDDKNSDWWNEGVEGISPGPNAIGVTGGTWSISYFHACV